MRRVFPPTYFLLTLITMTVLHLVWPVRTLWRFPLSLIGLVLVAVGVVFNVAADRQFHRHNTTVKPFQRSSALVTGFPFSVSRNPMYLGLVVALVGVALLLGTVSPFLPVVLFAILMDVRFVRVEERMLAETFGEEWHRYRVRVRRWV